MRGVRTTPSGLKRDGQPGPGYTPPTDIKAKVTVLAEGTRGALTQAWLRWQQVGSDNPMIYALGVKELWETKRPLDAVIHTLGWPLPRDAFGGSFFYPLEPNLLALGLVVGLDYRESTLDVHVLLQKMKRHPLFRPYLEGGEMVEWGAKTIPEGRLLRAAAAAPRRRGPRWPATPPGSSRSRRSRASTTRSCPACTRRARSSPRSRAATRRRPASPATTASSTQSAIVRDLRARRNMRLVFQKAGFYLGGIEAALMTVTGGAFPGGRIASEPDAEVPRRPVPAEPFTADGKLTFAKLDAVFKAGNATRDDIPSHLIVGDDTPPEVAEFYQHVCPAGVYERQGDRLVVNAPELRRLQGDGRPRPALDAARRRQRPALPAHVVAAESAGGPPRVGSRRAAGVERVWQYGRAARDPERQPRVVRTTSRACGPRPPRPSAPRTRPRAGARLPAAPPGRAAHRAPAGRPRSWACPARPAGWCRSRRAAIPPCGPRGVSTGKSGRCR